MSDPSVDSLLESLDFDKQISIDIGTELQLDIDGVEARVRSQFVGMKVGKYFVVECPTLSQIGGISVKLYGGNRVVVRYVFGGSVFGFETTIMELITSPVRLLFLGYPGVVNERNIRSNRRINTALPCKLQAEPEPVDGTITDISIAGCHFESKAANLSKSPSLAVGKKVEILLQLPGIADEFLVAGELKNVRKEAQRLELGIAFGELDENVKLAIDSYVKLSD